MSDVDLVEPHTHARSTAIDHPALWVHTPVVWVNRGRRIITDPNNPHFRFCDDGERAINCTINDEWGDPVDRVAWHPDDVRQWWVERGIEPVLGRDQVELAYGLDRELLIVGTPSEWLDIIGQPDHPPCAVLLDPRENPRPLFDKVKFCCRQDVYDHLLDCARRHEPLLNARIIGSI